MTLLEATIIFAISLMSKFDENKWPYDKAFIADVASAVVEITNDPAEVETLMRIARWESGGFRKDVASCSVKGDNGAAHGIWQVHPRTSAEAKLLCGTYKEQVAVALDRVRESIKVCSAAGYKDSALLSVYTRGSCQRPGTPEYSRWGTGKKIQKLMERN